MGKQRAKKGDKFKVTHNTFFEETFGDPSFRAISELVWSFSAPAGRWLVAS